MHGGMGIVCTYQRTVCMYVYILPLSLFQTATCRYVYVAAGPLGSCMYVCRVPSCVHPMGGSRAGNKDVGCRRWVIRAGKVER